MTLLFLPHAEIEALGIELSKKLGAKFGRAFQRTIESIESDPLILALIADGYRQRKIAGFPHRVVYIMNESNIIVVAIAHPSRAPYRSEQARRFRIPLQVRLMSSDLPTLSPSSKRPTHRKFSINSNQ